MGSRVPWWGVASSAAAPVLLMGGWTLAASQQPGGFDSARDTISALAAYGATERWVMTTALLGVGSCHVATALALAPAARPGRLLMALGGVATAAVGLSPLPANDNGSSRHTVAAVIAFSALAVWPAVGWRPGAATPAPLRRGAAAAAALVLSALVGGFFYASTRGAELTGLYERVAAGTQTMWPLLVVLGARAGGAARVA